MTDLLERYPCENGAVCEPDCKRDGCPMKAFQSVKPAETFGERLRDLRRGAKVSQRELATRIGVDFTYLSKIENGRMPAPSAGLISLIAGALGVDSDVLFSAAGKIPPELEAFSTRLPVIKLLHRLSVLSDEEIERI